MEEDYSEVAEKCINFSNQFKYSSHFSFSVNFDTFSFTVTHRKSRKSDEETQGRKKYVRERLTKKWTGAHLGGGGSGKVTRKSTSNIVFFYLKR